MVRHGTSASTRLPPPSAAPSRRTRLDAPRSSYGLNTNLAASGPGVPSSPGIASATPSSAATAPSSPCLTGHSAASSPSPGRPTSVDHWASSSSPVGGRHRRLRPPSSSSASGLTTSSARCPRQPLRRATPSAPSTPRRTTHQPGRAPRLHDPTPGDDSRITPPASGPAVSACIPKSVECVSKAVDIADYLGATHLMAPGRAEPIGQRTSRDLKMDVLQRLSSSVIAPDLPFYYDVLATRRYSAPWKPKDVSEISVKLLARATPEVPLPCDMATCPPLADAADRPCTSSPELG